MEKKHIDYTNEVDYDFVHNFAKEYCELVFKSNKFVIKKLEHLWVITCKIGARDFAIFHLTNFQFLNISKANKMVGEKMWREKLIKKFGNQYYLDLCEALTEDLHYKQKNEQLYLNKNIESYKQFLSNCEVIK